MIRAKYYSTSEDLALLHWLAQRSGEPTTVEAARVVCASYGAVAEVRDADGGILGYVGSRGHWWPVTPRDGGGELVMKT